MKNIDILVFLALQSRPRSIRDITDYIGRPLSEVKSLVINLVKENKVTKEDKAFRLTEQGRKYLKFYKLLEERNEKRLACV